MAVSTHVGAGLLLYGGPGFLPALTVVLAVASASLGAGLAWGGREGAGSSETFFQARIEEVRRGWFHLLVALALAAGFSASWEIFRGFGALGVTQAVGLLLLVSLPLVLGGRLLGLLRHDGSRSSHALYGAAVAILLLGHFFFPTLSPTAALLLCVVATSGGALSHGWLQDERLQLHDQSLDGVVIRELRRTRPLLHRVQLRHPGRVELTRAHDGAPVSPVDEALEGPLASILPPAHRVLAVGWRAAVSALRIHPGGSELTLVLSGDATRVREGLARLSGSPVPPGVELREGVEGAPPADRILLAWEGSEPGWASLGPLLRPGGVVVVTGVPDTADPRGLLGPLARARGCLGGGGAAWIGPGNGPELAAAGPLATPLDSPSAPGASGGSDSTVEGGERGGAGPGGASALVSAFRGVSPGVREGLLVVGHDFGESPPERLGRLLLAGP
jgi:hypothetical protein